VLKQGVVFITIFSEVTVPMSFVSYVVLNDCIIGSMNGRGTLESVMVGIVAKIGLVDDIPSSPRGEVVPMRGISSHVTSLARACKLSVLHTQDASKEGTRVSAKEIGISRTQRSIIALDFDISVQEADCCTKIGWRR
jgi:hypothetical protein